MAYSFPLSTADFFALLPVSEITFDAPPQVEINQTAGGEVLSADLGAMLWTGTVSLGVMIGAESADPDAMLDILRPSGRTFWAFDTRRPAPYADPKGLLLGTATPTIASLPNAREMTLAGLPAWYVLRRGDYLAFDYGSRRALHKVITQGVQATSAGITPLFEVTPMIRPGALVGAQVSLIQPACKALLVPNSVSKGTSKSLRTENMSFSFIQTLR